MANHCKLCGTPISPDEGEYCSKRCARHAERIRNKQTQHKPKPAAQSTIRKAAGALTISDIVQWAEQHHKDTGRRLWYGKAVAKLEGAGKLIPRSDRKAN